MCHRQQSLLAQRIYAIALGYEDLNDHQMLRNDSVLQLLCQDRLHLEQPLASAPTLCRLENRVHRTTLAAMSRLLVETFIASHTTPPKKLVLDFDATHDPVHGEQIGRSLRSFYDCWCYLPLYVFCGQQLLVAHLRPGNCDGAHHAGAILKLLVQRLRQAWPKVRIVFRGDSGFCRPRILSWCERNGVDYILGLQINAVLKEQAQSVIRKAQQRFEQTHQKQRWFGEFYYAAGSWCRKRRVILRHEHSAEGANPRFILTSLPGQCHVLYERDYCRRGEMENRIKEQQLGLFADRQSVPPAALGGGVGSAGPPAASGVGGERDGTGSGLDDSLTPAQARSSCGRERAAGGTASGGLLPAARALRPHRPATAAASLFRVIPWTSRHSSWG